MPEPPKSDFTVHRFPDLEALSRAAAQDLRADIETALRSRERYALGLAGGSTPERLYQILGTEKPLPWEQIHLFWGDERYVSPDHPKSNARLVRRTLVDEVPIPESNVHSIPTQGKSPKTDAAAYEDTLRRHFDSRTATFDTVLLGLGSDGHTASIFPETLAEDAEDEGRWVRVVTAPPRHDVATRLTCTLPVLKGARRALFLVSGERKRDALHRVLDCNDPALPATHVQPEGECLWYVDPAARPAEAGDHA